MTGRGRLPRPRGQAGGSSDAPEPSEAPEPSDERWLRLPGAEAREVPEASLVVGYRQGPAAVHAVVVAADLARRMTAHLHVVHVVDLSDYPIDPDAWDWEVQAEKTLKADQDRIRELLLRQPAGWSYHAGHGDPVALLAKVATEHSALMIIVGSQGDTVSAGLQRLINGHSVSHGLIRGRHHPILVVPQASRR